MKSDVDVNIKKLSDNAITPTYGTKSSAGADLYALPVEDNAEIHIKPGETVFVHTGIAVEIPEGFVGLVFARSGLSCKRGLAPANKVGVIDSDYRGEIIVALYNQGVADAVVSGGERIAQLVIVPYAAAVFREVEELGDTVRGNGGFGSTGKL